jgi:hypothetical protein
MILKSTAPGVEQVTHRSWNQAGIACRDQQEAINQR